MRNRILVLPWAALPFLLPAPPAAAQNLLQNPGFTSALAPWQPFNAFDVTAEWSVLDASGDPASGSIRGTLPEVGIFRIPIYASQCVPVQPGRAYRFGGSILLPAATTPEDAFATVFVNTYLAAGCGGNNSSHLAAPNVTAIGAWTATTASLVTGPGIQSAQFHLRVFAPSGTRLSSHFDDLYLEPEDKVLIDGFE